MQAIILAGGFGTRLRSVIADLPKPLAPIHDKPFLAYLLHYLKSQGVTHIVLSVHFMGEKIQDYFKSTFEGLKIDYAIEKEPLGTGGAILHSLNFIDPQKPVFVLNGDTFLKCDYKKMLQAHGNSQLTMALRPVPDVSRYGYVIVKNDQVVSFQEKGIQQPGLINAGVYLLQAGLFKEYHLPEVFSFETDFLFKHINELHPRAFIVDDYFIDIGVPEDYEKARQDFSSNY